MVPPSLKITGFDYKPSFKKDLRRLDPGIRKDVQKAINDLKGDNELSPGRHLKKLKGSNAYSIRIGRDYRLSFEVDGEIAILRRVGPRQKFYESY